MKIVVLFIIVSLLNGLVDGRSCPKLCASNEPRCPPGFICQADSKGIGRCNACPEGATGPNCGCPEGTIGPNCTCPEGVVGPNCEYQGCYSTYGSTGCVGSLTIVSNGKTILGEARECYCDYECLEYFDCCFDSDCPLFG